MPETTLPANISAAKDTWSGYADTAADFAAKMPTIGDELKKTITDLYADNADLVNQFDVASGNFVSAPSEAREKYQNIFNPFEREKLVSKYTQGQAIPMLSFANMLGNRFGRVDEMIGAGTNAFEAGALGAQSQADFFRQQYEDKFNEYTTMEDLRIREMQARNSGSGGVSGIDIGALVAQLQGILQNGVQTPGQISSLTNYGYDQSQHLFNPYNIPTSPFAPASQQNPFGQVRLTDPQTGDVYFYDGVTDPDFISDLQKGYQIPNQ